MKQYSYEKKELEKKLKEIDPAIRALEDNKPEPLNWNELESEKTMLESLMEETNASIADSGKLDEARQREINAVRTSISAKRKEFYNVTNSIEDEKQRIKREASQSVYAKGEEKRKHETKLKELINEKSSLQSSIETLTIRAERLQKEKEDLFAQYNKEQETTFQSDDSSTVCPLLANHICNSPELLSYMEKNREKAEADYNRKKAEKIESIIKEGKAKRKEEEDAKATIEEYKQRTSSIERQIEAENTVISSFPDYEKPIEETPTSSKLEELNEKRMSLNADIAALEEELKAKENAEKPDNTELLAKKTDLKLKYEDIVGRLSIKSQIEKTNRSISEYKEKANNLSSMISELNNKEFTAKEINRASVEEATERVNKLFSFIEWQMFELQKNGLYAEVCKPTIDGVSQSLNTESMINAGIDIANTISRFKDVSAPLFIDNHESVNKTLPTVGQSINLFVAPKGTELTLKIEK